MKSKKMSKKQLSIIGIIAVLFVIILIAIFNRTQVIENEFIDFFDYKEPYDGKVKLCDYKSYTIDLDAVLEEYYETYVNDLVASSIDFGKEIDSVVKEDSLVRIHLSLSDGENTLRTSTAHMDFTEVTFGEDVNKLIKDALIGKKAGETFEFTIKAGEHKDITLLEAQKEMDITYSGTLEAVLEGYVYPEFNDEFVKSELGFDTVAEFKEHFMLESLVELYVDEARYNQIIWDEFKYLILEDSKVIKKATPLVNIYKETVVDYVTKMAGYFGYSPEFYIQSVYDMTWDEYLQKSIDELSARDTVIIALALEEELKISDEMHSEYIKELALANGYTDIESFINANSAYYDERTEKQTFAEDLVASHLLQYVTVKESKYHEQAKKIADEYLADYEEVMGTGSSSSENTESEELIDIFDILDGEASLEDTSSISNSDE